MSRVKASVKTGAKDGAKKSATENAKTGTQASSKSGHSKSRKKTAREKLNAPHEPELVEMAERDSKRLGPGKMLIPTPLEVDAEIRTANKKGKLITTAEIRDRMARRHGAKLTCPLVTGIFVRVSAEAAEEDRAEGKTRITPYWRVIQEDGSLLEKIPGGAEAQAKLLRSEGHEIDRTRKAPRVQGFAGRKAAKRRG
jgi:hypothetical protein